MLLKVLDMKETKFPSRHSAMQVQDLEKTISGLRAAAEQGRDTTAAELADVSRQLSEVTGQLTEAQRKQARAAAKAEEQAARADKWESECIGVCTRPHYSIALFRTLSWNAEYCIQIA